MRLLLIVTCFILSNQVNLFSQDINTIKIVGLSEKSFQADGINISINLKEIPRDEYKKIRERSIEEVKSEFLANLKVMGFTPEDLDEVWPPQKSYGRQKQESYTLKVPNKDQAKEVAGIQVNGVTFSNFKYSYPKDLNIDTEKMAMEALDDAKRKALVLAKKVNKKIGKVIRVMDLSGSSKISFPSYNDKETYTYNYKLTVTYELLD